MLQDRTGVERVYIVRVNNVLTLADILLARFLTEGARTVGAVRVVGGVTVVVVGKGEGMRVHSL